MSAKRFPRRLVAVGAAMTTVGASVAIGLAGAAPAAADDAASSGVAYLRTAHLSPDTPKVDVYLTAFRGGSSKLWLSGIGYGDVTHYRRMSAGQYAVAMRPAGAAASTPAALSWTVTLRRGASYTAAAIGSQTKLRGMVIPDSRSTPRAGTGYLRVVQASDRAKNVAVTAGGTTVTGNIAFGSVSRYVSVRAGSVPLTAKAVAGSKVADSRTVQVPSQSATTVLLLDEQGGGIQARPLIDAAGPAHSPTGSVETGGGGTATTIVHRPGALSGLGALIAAGALVLAACAGTLCVAATRRRTGVA